MFWLFVVALWTALLLAPIALLYAFLPSGRGCPRCGHETVPIRSWLLHPVRRLTALRWCLDCGWQGLMRHGRNRAPVPTLEVVPDDAHAHDTDGDAPWKGGPVL